MRAFETEKTEVAEIDRSVYDIKDKVNAAFEVNSGLTAEIVEQISKEKHDPDWMREFRLKALDIYNKASIPNWGPSLEGLDMRNIVTYVRPQTPRCAASGAKCPMTSRTRLSVWGIPQARALEPGGASAAQYDSEVVYHNRQGGGRRAGRRLHRYGERPDRPLRRHGEGALHEVRAPHGPQVCGAARRCVERRFLRLRPGGRACGHSLAVLLPPECPRRGPVRAHPDYRGQGRIPALYRGLLGPEVQRRQPARRLRRDFRR